MLGTLAPARRRFVLVLSGAFVVALAVGIAPLVVPLLAGGRTADQSIPGPVLLVSGYGGSTTSLQPLRRRLERQGREVVVVRVVGRGTGDLGEQAARLAVAARRALARTGSASVDVVGYSAGGVVARTWVRDDGGASVARRVLSIGSPQHGTELAALAVGLAGRCPAACEELAPDSAFLTGLNAGDETPGGPRFVSVWSTADRVVVPADSARLVGALNFTVQSRCPASRTAHGALPADPVVLAALASTLGSGPPRPPSDVACRRVSS